jgi:single-stranded-DNA-specific exonuclease
MRPPAKRWNLLPALPPALARELGEAVGDLPYAPLLVQLLYNRNITSASQAAAFLGMEGAALNDPYLFRDMGKAAARIADAVSSGERIAIYGDYDADGITATAVLVRALTAMGANVEPYIPHRSLEGYGMNLDAIGKLAERGVGLIVTVDCGISNLKEVGEAMRRYDIEVIVTDHHRAPRELPPAYALISARRPDNTYPFADLTGVGIAYQIVRALAQRGLTMQGVQPRDLIELVAIGTVADMAPLHGDNRILVQHGLRSLRVTRSPGLQALYSVARTSRQNVDAGTIGFIIAPRLNAAGRLESAMASYKLLMCDDLLESTRLAGDLELRNRERQQLTSAIVADAMARAAALPDDTPLILLHGRDWNAGVVGLAAARLLEEFHRPVLIIEEGDQMSKGSARSISAFNITAALTEVGHLLSRYGGHAAAAGFSVETSKLGELAAGLREVAARQLSEADFQAELRIDAELPIDRLTPTLVEALNLLAPYGMGNATPLFIARNLRVAETKLMGKDRQHLRITLNDPLRLGHATAVAWRRAEWLPFLETKPLVDVVYQVEKNEWQGSYSIQMNVRDIRPAQT